MAEEKYKFYDPKLMDTAYQYGDAYNNRLEGYRTSAVEWDISTKLEEGKYDQSYLKYVKDLSSNGWPHLRVLADFMEVTTDPRRWHQVKYQPAKRSERSKRTRVCRIDYPRNNDDAVRHFENAENLAEDIEAINPAVDLRLYVVEDLSRDVIEYLGKNYNVEPDFFRDHILDFAWSNVRDFWRNPPMLSKELRDKKRMQLRFVTARYFQDSAGFKRATEEAQNWNVFRRPDDDSNDKVSFDSAGSIVSLTRTRASFWYDPTSTKNGGKAVAILLLDPTLKSGFPLWRGRRNWEPTPSFEDRTTKIVPPVGQERPDGMMDFYGDFICWAKRASLFPKPDTPANDNSGITSHVHVPVQALLHLICSEWLTLAEYIKARLTQIEWEIAFPENFIRAGGQIDDALKRLHMWRRLVPLYREMLAETLDRVFHYPSHDEPEIAPDSCSCHARKACLPHASSYPYHAIGAYRHDYVLALSSMKEYQERIDRLTSVITAVIGIKDSHRAIDDSQRAQIDNQNLGRLSWLGTFFLPYSLVAGVFGACSAKDISVERARLYFAVAVPLAVLTFLVAVILALPQVQRGLRALFSKLLLLKFLGKLHLLPEKTIDSPS